MEHIHAIKIQKYGLTLYLKINRNNHPLREDKGIKVGKRKNGKFYL